MQVQSNCQENAIPSTASRFPTNSTFVFPEHAMIGSIGDLARVMAFGTEVPEAFYFAAGLTTLGSMCGKDLTVNVGFKVELRLYTVLLGDSYAVKKSTAMKKTLEFFKTIPIRTPHLNFGVGSAEGLVQ